MSSVLNGFTQGSVSKVLLRTAVPIVFLTSVNGLLTVVDAILLGVFVGPSALAAVTLMFPASMLLIALSIMVSSGMASIVARQLGGGRIKDARSTFAGAHGLSLLICVVLAGAFVVVGSPLTSVMSVDATLAGMGHQFLAISVFTTPIMFLVSLHSDALRVEGEIGFMAMAGLVVTLGNIVSNVVLIAGMGLGVAGSAWGTALAQTVALGLMLVFRIRGKGKLAVPTPRIEFLKGWMEILTLGAPRSLSFLGIALGAAATLASVRLHVTADQDQTVAAYGAVTRMMTFAYLPLLGLSMAMQAVVGNNYGAGLRDRSDQALKQTIGAALCYGIAIEIILLLFKDSIGGLFVADPGVVAEVGRILPFYTALYFTMGPIMMIASYLQSIGDAKRSAFLSLARTYLYAVPLAFALPALFGEAGIWLALPLADLLLVITTAIVLRGRSAMASPAAA
ncbi:MAG TPA: MATE family efflux transporter [Devosia sp.]